MLERILIFLICKSSILVTSSIWIRAGSGADIV